MVVVSRQFFSFSHCITSASGSGRSSSPRFESVSFRRGRLLSVDCEAKLAPRQLHTIYQTVVHRFFIRSVILLRQLTNLTEQPCGPSCSCDRLDLEIRQAHATLLALPCRLDTAVAAGENDAFELIEHLR